MNDYVWTGRHDGIHNSVLIQAIHHHWFCALVAQELNLARTPSCSHNLMAFGDEERNESPADCSSRACHDDFHLFSSQPRTLPEHPG